MERRGHLTTILPFFTFLCTVMTRELFILVVPLEGCDPVAKVPDWACEFIPLDTILKKFPNFGSSVNIPWPEKGMGDAEYIYAFQKVVMPIAMEFAPELVISMLNRLPTSPALMSRHM